MAHFDRATQVAVYIKTLLTDNKVTLGIDNVIYGDQLNIPGGMTVVVDSGTKTRVLQGNSAIQVAPNVFSGGRTRNKILVTITIYNSEYGSEEDKRLQVDQKAEDIEHFLHQDTSLGGNIIHGFVETWSPGLQFKNGTQFRVCQMIYAADTKTSLPDLP